MDFKVCRLSITDENGDVVTEADDVTTVTSSYGTVDYDRDNDGSTPALKVPHKLFLHDLSQALTFRRTGRYYSGSPVLIHIHFDNLLRLARAGRSLRRAVAAGAMPPEMQQLWNRMENSGVEVHIFDRGSQDQGEQGVPDQWLQLRMLEDAVDHNGAPGVVVLLTGDGAGYVTEERRSCFVAITRARQRLILSRAKQYRGRTRPPSRLLREMGLLNGSSPGSL